MTTAFRHIRHADGRAYYEGKPLSLADAQIMLNDDIVRRQVRVDAYLRIDGAGLILEAGCYRNASRSLSPRAGQPG